MAAKKLLVVSATGKKEQYTTISTSAGTASEGGVPCLDANGLLNANMIPARMVSILDFTGIDPTGATDSTTAIQAAIDSGASKIRFNAGTYKITTLVPNSNQIWEGDGKSTTTLTWAQSNQTSNQNMIKSDGDLADFTAKGMTLRGSLLYQTSDDGTGQNLACFHLRGGSVNRITLEDLKIYEFGSQGKASGAGAFIGPVAGTGKSVTDITITGCEFTDIANVPGVYINANEAYCTSAQRIKIIGNTFKCTANYADQNMVYVLTKGDGSVPAIWAEDVTIDNNTFIATYQIDCAVELNECNKFSISGNSISASSAADMTGILLRSRCKNGIIALNTLVNSGTGCTTTAGICAIPHTAEAAEYSATDLIIDGNMVYDFKLDGIICNRTIRCAITNNSIVGSANRITNGIFIGAATDLSVAGNRLKKCTVAVGLATGVGGILRGQITGNTMDDCGSSGGHYIAGTDTGQDVTYLNIENNIATNPVASTTAFYAPSFAASTGNTVRANQIPSTLTLVNASYAAYVESSTTVPRATGNPMIAFSATSWAQGTVSMSAGVGYTIPGAPGQAVTGAALGDSVLIGCSKDTLGCSITGYVPAAGYIRARVQNGTTADAVIDAATWYATLVKKQ